MVKKIKFLRVLCLLLCLFLFGCGDNSTDTADDSVGDTADTGNDIVMADTNQPTQTEPDVTDTTAPEESTDAPTETTEDTTSDTEKPAETGKAPISDTPPETMPGTDTAESPRDTAAPEEIPDVIEPDEIDLGGKLSVGKPVSGQFISHQSDKMYLVVRYTCNMDNDGGVAVDLEIGLETYDINCGSRIDTGKITVDGVTQKFSTGAIQHESRSKEYIPFTIYSFTSADGQDYCEIDVSWLFNGTYAGKKIDTLTASAVISWDGEPTA